MCFYGNTCISIGITCMQCSYSGPSYLVQTDGVAPWLSDVIACMSVSFIGL